MNSREKILSVVKKNQPQLSELPDIRISTISNLDTTDKFREILTSIGGTAIDVNSWDDIEEYCRRNFPDKERNVSAIPELSEAFGFRVKQNDPHEFGDVKLAILKGSFGVAENGAIWITSNQMGDRALPFICEHLALVIDVRDIVPSMQEAYEKIGDSSYGFGTFIAGPSKTADIEQALVLGAHGAKSMTVFLMKD